MRCYRLLNGAVQTALGGAACLLLAACSSDAAGTSMTSGGGSIGGMTTSAGAGGSEAGGTNASGQAAAGAPETGGGSSSSGPVGNPDASCSTPLPQEAKLADVSKPTTVVGNGMASSCTFAALKAAVAGGGVITFNCGAAPVTLTVTETLEVPSNKDTVIDGGGSVTLDGGKAVQVLRFVSDNFQANDHGLTLQRIRIANGKTTPVQKIPEAPAPCSQGFNDGQGGGLFIRDGYLRIIDSVFADNEGAPRGPDTGGGGVYILGSKAGALIVHSTFSGNKASVGGGIGGLFSPLRIYSSLFTDNHATGDGANSDDASKCSAMNNGQNEVGSGGNGGPIYSDGNSVDVVLCGDKVVGNSHGAGAFGAGLFFTSNNRQGNLTIVDTTITGNTSADGKLGFWASVNNDANAMTKLGTAVGTNCNSLTLMNSTLQGT